MPRFTALLGKNERSCCFSCVQDVRLFQYTKMDAAASTLSVLVKKCLAIEAGGPAKVQFERSTNGFGTK